MATFMFTKRTSNDNTFILELSEGGTLREWWEGSTEAEGWSGTWRSGSMKGPTWFIETYIGPYTTMYKLDHGLIIGVETSSESEGETMCHIDSFDRRDPITTMGILQGKGMK